VDYPILQNPDDDEYYLHRDIYGNEEYAGSLFTQATYDTKDFEKDPVTVVYGHSMKNGTMLRSIKNYMDRDFFDTHPDFVVYTPDSILHYQVFAAYITDDTHIPATYNFEIPTGLTTYINDIYAQRDMSANFNTEIRDTLNEESKILTLSTCYDADSQMRYLLQAVLTEVEH
jgi:sortase B